MYGAVIGYPVQVVALSFGEVSLQRQLDLQTVLAGGLFAVVALDLDGHAGQRNVFLLRIELQGQCLAGAQRCIEIVVGGRCRIASAQCFGQIGLKSVKAIDVDAVAKTVARFGMNGDSNGNPFVLWRSHPV